MVIFLDPVSLLQAFGYSIALGGLVYYKLGAESLKGYFYNGNRKWAEYGVNHPAQRKIVIFGIVVVVLFMILGGLGVSSVTDGKRLVGLLGGGKSST